MRRLCETTARLFHAAIRTLTSPGFTAVANVLGVLGFIQGALQ
jgi:hypothetical protein